MTDWIPPTVARAEKILEAQLVKYRQLREHYETIRQTKCRCPEVYPACSRCTALRQLKQAMQDIIL